MNLKKALLMVFLVGLCFLYYRHIQNQDLPDQIAQEESPIFENIELENLNYVGVKHLEGGFEIRKQEDDSWHLLNPKGVPAVKEKVKKLLQAIKKLSAENTISEEEYETDEVYGFDNPELALVFTDRSTKTIIHFGKKHPFSPIRYARLKDQKKVYLINEYGYLSFKKKEQSFWLAKPLKFELSEVKSLKAERVNENTTLELIKKDKAWLAKIGKEEVEANPELVESALADITNKSVKGYLTGEYAGFSGEGALEHPSLVFTIVKNDNSEFSVIAGDLNRRKEAEESGETEIIDTKPEYYFKIKGKPWIYYFEGNFFRELFFSLEYYKID